jgi:DNA-damage-inducible protein D
MAEDNLPAADSLQPRARSFEQLKRVNQHGAEYWSARDLQTLLGYSQWRRFEQAVTRAMTSCSQSGNDPDHHFAGARKMIGLGKGGTREVPDFHLSRFAWACANLDWRAEPAEVGAAHRHLQVLRPRAAARINPLRR